MPGTTFLPSQDRALLAWATTLSAIVLESPETYGVSPQLASAFAERVAEFATAMDACEPQIRSRVSTAGKNTTREALKNDARAVVRFIKAQTTVTSAQWIALGLTVPQRVRRIAPPDNAPFVKILSVSGCTVSLQLCDGQSRTRRGRPPGAVGASLFSCVSETEPAGLSEMKFEGNTGQTTIALEFPGSLAPGTQVWIAANWFSGRKENSPLSRPARTTLQGGTISMRAA